MFHPLLPLGRTSLLVGLLCLAAAAQVPINSLPYAIDEPGSYILTQNLRGERGILISTSHVTLDLGGYVLLGTSGSQSDGVLVRGEQTNLEIRNGTITGWGGRGIMAEQAVNSYYHDLRLAKNGLCGLRAGRMALVEQVVARKNAFGSGIVTLEASIVKDSITADNGGWGLDSGTCSVVTDCSIFANDGGGVLAGAGSRVYGNSIQDNGFGFPEADGPGCYLVTLAGVAVLGEGSSIEDNVITGNMVGLHLLSEGNVVAENVVKGNEDNYDLVPGNQLELLLCELPESIDWPATVRLAGTLHGVEGQPGLSINADGVMVDLAGHSMVGVPGSISGILVESPIRDLTVKDGVISDWDGCGISALLASASRIEGVQVKANGLSGMRVGQGSLVSNSAAHSNALDGILTQMDCVVTACSAIRNGNDGINVRDHSLISNSVASENEFFGLRTGRGSQVSGCTASSNNLGIAVEAGSSVLQNTVSFSTGLGIRVDGRCLVKDNTLHGNHAGLFTAFERSRIEGNTFTNNTKSGLRVAGEFNLILCNSASGNTPDYSIDPNNTYGPIMVVAGAGAMGPTDPWANFSF